MKKQHILIIPGLGDDRWALKFQTRKWEVKYNIVPHVWVFGWQATNSTFEKQLRITQEEVNSLVAKYGKISLLGTSAGGSAVINLYSNNKDKIEKVICVCARLKNANVTQRPYLPKKKLDLFIESIKTCEKNIARLTSNDKKKIMTIRPIYDDVVPVRTMSIDRATNYKIFGLQHILNIYLAVTWRSKIIADFIKR